MKTKQLIDLIFNEPTAPFREHYVLDKIKSILDKFNIPFFIDPSGNVIAGAESTKHIPKNPHFVFVAHTDHPGFLVNKKKLKNVYLATWYGGAPFKQMKGARVRAYSNVNKNSTFKAVINRLKPYKRSGTEIQLFCKAELDNSFFGAFDFVGASYKKDRVKTRAADDLAGVVMALGAMIDLRAKNTLAVFTRAEEIGFIGCIGLLEEKILNPKNSLIISLEASRTLPGALLNEGPVIRLGDLATIFDVDINRYVTKIASELKNKTKKFKFQRRVMDGGTCEATAFQSYGFKTLGIAVPLQNYHNQGIKGPAPEIISINDVENGIKLLVQIAKKYKHINTVSNELHKKIKRQFKVMRPLLIKTRSKRHD